MRRQLNLWMAAGMVAIGLAGAVHAAELPPMEGRTNLAAGKTIQFAPTPNYSLTSRDGTDTTDLTDGKLTQREDREAWRESLAVGWVYAGRVNLALDLGQPSRIDEVAMRFVGRAWADVSTPGWVEVLVSDDGEHYRKVGTFSRFEPGAIHRLGLTGEEEGAWINCLRITDLEATGRYVALRMYTNGLSVSDELYVFGEPVDETASARAGEADKAESAGESTGFTVEHPQPYFHKPYLVLATNLAAPLPIGIATPGEGSGGDEGTVTLSLDVPAGIELQAGEIGDTNLADVDPEPLPEGGRRYQFTADSPAADKVFGRLYVQASGWSDGQTGMLRYRFSHGDWESGEVAVPLRGVTVPPTPRLEQLMISMGWWHATATAKWPDALDAWQRLGLNTLPLFPFWVSSSGEIYWKMEDQAHPAWEMIEKARDRGFMIATIDSALRWILRRHGDAEEIYCQFEDGGVGDHLCPSYRGPHYQEEVARFARSMSIAQPDHASLDIELWGWRGPIANSKQCTRCQADFEASGLEAWDPWLARQGNEIWSDLITAARDAGAGDFQIGGYDFRPGHVYQNVWSFDQLYPEYMDVGQVSTYSPLYPHHLVEIGDVVRESRAQLPESDSMPWISPGDAGTFTGEAFQWALLECYTNGARGVWFWSSRVWDAESLISYSRVVRAIAPVEQVIVEGELIGDRANVIEAGRVSGIRRGDEIVLLVADYFGQANGSVELQLDLPTDATVVDLFSGAPVVPDVEAGAQTLTIELADARARLLHVRPKD